MSSGEKCLSKKNCVPIGKLFLINNSKIYLFDRPKIDQSIIDTYYVFQKTCTITNVTANVKHTAVFEVMPSPI